MAYFTERDRALIEALEYDPAMEPGFELLKGCLIWRDERPDGLTSEGYDALCDLWGARGFLHRGRPFTSYSPNPQYFGKRWEEALRDGFRWPGFRRLTLSEKDRAYLEQCLQEDEF